MKKLFYLLLVMLLLISVGCESKEEENIATVEPPKVEENKNYSSNTEKYSISCTEQAEVVDLGTFKIDNQEVEISYSCRSMGVPMANPFNLNINDKKISIQINDSGETTGNAYIKIFNDKFIAIVDRFDNGYRTTSTALLYDINGNKAADIVGKEFSSTKNDIISFKDDKIYVLNIDSNDKLYQDIYEYENGQIVYSGEVN